MHPLLDFGERLVFQDTTLTNHYMMTWPAGVQKIKLLMLVLNMKLQKLISKTATI